MVPDLHYSEENYKTISNIQEYEPYVMSSILIFLVYPETFEYELEMRSFTKDDKKLFYVVQRQGGPTIDFYSPGLIEDRDKMIGPGFLGNYSFYYSKNKKIYPTELQKDLYKMLAKFIKEKCKQVKLKKRSYWIGDRTIYLCKNENYKLVEIGGFNLIEAL